MKKLLPGMVGMKYMHKHPIAIIDELADPVFDTGLGIDEIMEKKEKEMRIEGRISVSINSICGLYGFLIYNYSEEDEFDTFFNPLYGKLRVVVVDTIEDTIRDTFFINKENYNAILTIMERVHREDSGFCYYNNLKDNIDPHKPIRLHITQDEITIHHTRNNDIYKLTYTDLINGLSKFEDLVWYSDVEKKEVCESNEKIKEYPKDVIEMKNPKKEKEKMEIGCLSASIKSTNGLIEFQIYNYYKNDKYDYCPIYDESLRVVILNTSTDTIKDTFFLKKENYRSILLEMEKLMKSVKTYNYYAYGFTTTDFDREQGCHSSSLYLDFNKEEVHICHNIEPNAFAYQLPFNEFYDSLWKFFDHMEVKEDLLKEFTKISDEMMFLNISKDSHLIESIKNEVKNIKEKEMKDESVSVRLSSINDGEMYSLQICNYEEDDNFNREIYEQELKINISDDDGVKDVFTICKSDYRKILKFMKKLLKKETLNYGFITIYDKENIIKRIEIHEDYVKMNLHNLSNIFKLSFEELYDGLLMFKDFMKNKKEKLLTPNKERKIMDKTRMSSFIESTDALNEIHIYNYSEEDDFDTPFNEKYGKLRVVVVDTWQDIFKDSFFIDKEDYKAILTAMKEVIRGDVEYKYYCHLRSNKQSGSITLLFKKDEEVSIYHKHTHPNNEFSYKISFEKLYESLDSFYGFMIGHDSFPTSTDEKSKKEHSIVKNEMKSSNRTLRDILDETLEDKILKGLENGSITWIGCELGGRKVEKIKDDRAINNSYYEISNNEDTEGDINNFIGDVLMDKVLQELNFVDDEYLDIIKCLDDDKYEFTIRSKKNSYIRIATLKIKTSIKNMDSAKRGEN
jgi:hypothetical protein